jgi:N-acyl-D-amino-acid deacylase
VLGHWVRERSALSLEQAVWRLTDQPHQVFRLADRGPLREGFHADLVAFDPDTVGITEAERIFDQPGGADRVIVRSTGIEHVWVNGVPIRSRGADSAAVGAGRLLTTG